MDTINSPVNLKDLSHNLRTPLSVILGLTQQLIQEALTSYQQEQLENIRKAGNQLLATIDQLLNIPSAIPPHSIDYGSLPKNELRILLVEDDRLLQMIHGNMLKKMGYKVDIAKNGKEALALFKSNQYVFVLMDIGLPDMNGIEVTSKIRHTKSEQPTPIIALTAYTDNQTKMACKKAGMNEVLFKPIQEIDLKTILNQYVSECHKV